jgi:hypothetical protein
MNSEIAAISDRLSVELNINSDDPSHIFTAAMFLPLNNPTTIDKILEHLCNKVKQEIIARHKYPDIQPKAYHEEKLQEANPELDEALRTDVADGADTFGVIKVLVAFDTSQKTKKAKLEE